MEKCWYEIIKFEFDDEFNQLPAYMQKCIKSNRENPDRISKKDSDPNITDIANTEDLNLLEGEKIKSICFYAGKLTRRCPDCEGYGFVNNMRCPRCIGWGIEYLEKNWTNTVQVQTESGKIFRIKNITQKDVKKIQSKARSEWNLLPER